MCQDNSGKIFIILILIISMIICMSNDHCEILDEIQTNNEIIHELKNQIEELQAMQIVATSRISWSPPIDDSEVKEPEPIPVFNEYPNLTIDIYNAVMDASEIYPSIKPELIFAIIYEESRYIPDVVSSANCVGLMQISPKWHTNRAIKLCGIKADLFDIRTNIIVGFDILYELQESYSIEEALMIYNMGFKKARENMDNNTLTTYASNIIQRSEQFKELLGGA